MWLDKKAELVFQCGRDQGRDRANADYLRDKLGGVHDRDSCVTVWIRQHKSVPEIELPTVWPVGHEWRKQHHRGDNCGGDE